MSYNLRTLPAFLAQLECGVESLADARSVVDALQAAGQLCSQCESPARPTTSRHVPGSKLTARLEARGCPSARAFELPRPASRGQFKIMWVDSHPDHAPRPALSRRKEWRAAGRHALQADQGGWSGGGARRSRTDGGAPGQVGRVWGRPVWRRSGPSTCDAGGRLKVL